MNEVLRNLKGSHLLFIVNVCALRYIVLTLQLYWLIPMATTEHFDETYINSSFSIVDDTIMIIVRYSKKIREIALVSATYPVIQSVREL